MFPPSSYFLRSPGTGMRCPMPWCGRAVLKYANAYSSSTVWRCRSFRMSTWCLAKPKPRPQANRANFASHRTHHRGIRRPKPRIQVGPRRCSLRHRIGRSCRPAVVPSTGTTHEGPPRLVDTPCALSCVIGCPQGRKGGSWSWSPNSGSVPENKMRPAEPALDSKCAGAARGHVIPISRLTN